MQLLSSTFRELLICRFVCKDYFLVPYFEEPETNECRSEEVENQSDRSRILYEYAGMKATENPLHIAAKSADQEKVAEILTKNPEFALQMNHDGYTALHLACWKGHLAVIREFIYLNSMLCLLKDKYGRTPLHTAAMKGKTDIMMELLSACPDSATEITKADETPLHIAMNHGQGNAVELLLDWIKERPNFGDLINKKDSAGNTVLHLAVSRKDIQTVRLLLDESRAHNAQVKINALNAGGFTALDIFDVLPHEDKDMDIEKIFGRTGALRANDFSKRRLDYSTNESEAKSQRKLYQSSHSQTTIPTKTKYLLREEYNVCFVAATLIATMTFLAILNPPRFWLDESYKLYSPTVVFPIDKQRSYLTHLFVLFDSIAFITSTALMIIILVRELPTKTWLLVSVFSMFGAFICSIKAISPGDALPVLLIGSPLILLAAVSEYLCQSSTLFKHLRSLCVKSS